MFNSTKDICIHQLFELQVSKTPEAVAVRFQDRELTYRQVNQKANQLAHALKRNGVKPEALVGICLERSPLMLVAFLGVLKAGGAYVPLEPTYPKERLAFILEDSQLFLLLTQESLLNNLPQHSLPVICLDRDWQNIARHSEDNPDRRGSSDNLAYVIYTSGSTGVPKGVMIEHRSLVNFAQAVVGEYELNSSDRVLQFASISFDASVEEIYPCLISGGTLILRTDEILYSIPQFLQNCRDNSVTVLDLPTAFWHLLAAELNLYPELTLPETIRLVIIGGETANPERVASWQNRFGSYPQLINTYGPTEATVVATIYRVPSLSPGNDSEQSRSSIPIGRPLPNLQTYVLDKNGQPVPPGIAGELYLGGIGLARGYLNRPELTRKNFIAHPFNAESGERLYKTGDLVCSLADGNLQFLGRIDTQVKLRGFRVELTEIEAAISLYPDVRETAVIAYEPQSGNKCLVAYVVSSLIPDRISYPRDCLVEVDGKIAKLRTEDISNKGACLVGSPATWEKGKKLRLRLLLPGEQQERWLWGTVMWLQFPRAGIEFQLNHLERQTIQVSIDYLLQTQGLLKILQRSVTKNLGNYLKKTLPPYMIPHHFILLSTLPLTSNGKVDQQKLLLYLHDHQQSRDSISQTLMPTEAELVALWSELLGVEVGIRDNFFNLGGSSLLVARMIAQVEARFSVELPVKCFFESPTVAHLAKILEQLRQGKIAISEKPLTCLKADALLDSTISMPQLIQSGGSFLTGATGFLGVHLLYELLEQTSGPIYCLVRADNPTAGKKRIKDKLVSHALWQETFSPRLVPVIGDLSKPLFGLEEQQFCQLANQIEAIYHCGALVNFVYPYSALKPTNVLGTQEVLRLAVKAPFKPVHYISSLSVFDSFNNFDGRTIQEEDWYHEPEKLFSGYAQSKWVAEQLVSAARERGLPVCIYRPAEIIGHSQTSIWNLEDYLCHLIKGCLQLEAWPDLDMTFNLTPVDFASRAILYLSQKPSSLGKVFHVLNPQTVHWHTIFRWVKALGYPLKLISYKQWRAKLFEAFRQSQDNSLFKLSHFFRDVITSDDLPLTLQEIYVQSRAPVYSYQNLQSGLAGSSIVCPAINAQLWKMYCSYFRREGFIEDPEFPSFSPTAEIRTPIVSCSNSYHVP
jgi:amino acid adenylation domain-containing protein/thioester reductase-like protein